MLCYVLRTRAPEHTCSKDWFVGLLCSGKAAAEDLVSSQSSLRQVVTLTTKLGTWAQLVAAAMPGDPHCNALQEQQQQQGDGTCRQPGSSSRKPNAAGLCSLCIGPLAPWTWTLTSASGGGCGLRWPGCSSVSKRQQDEENESLGLLGTCVIVALQEVGSLAGSVNRRFVALLVSSNSMQQD
jgi:hypothetical protein